MDDRAEWDNGRLRYRRDGTVGRVIFDNPARRNAMTLGMWEGLAALAGRASAAEGLRVVTLEGAGGQAFVSGADISEFGAARSGAEAVSRYDATVDRAVAALAALPMPVVALIRGHCIGGGLALALAADLRLGAWDARFALPPARLGLGLGLDAVAALVRRVGPGMAADMLFTGRMVGAEEARTAGLCDRLLDAEGFAAGAAAVVDAIAANAPLTLRAAKAALVELARPEAARDPGRVDALVAACYESADYREGQAAFAEKRAPVFRGR